MSRKKIVYIIYEASFMMKMYCDLVFREFRRSILTAFSYPALDILRKNEVIMSLFQNAFDI